ncbi:uracil-DNA glycosylase [Spiroplasma endosymbiont of Labia minor]|uniref:uracil-DNA glycosylase n=1 Tax=Spiroplasma endosymbiont of Labia minor TaxID=3066305 RepID=UPI0030CB48D0
MMKIDSSWQDFFSQEYKKDYYKKLMKQIEFEYKNKNVFPSHDDLFRLFSLVKSENIKVVIIGQDPYHGINQANGLAFSTNSFKTPPSLKNIFKELKDDLGVDHSFANSLDGWAKQGIFLMNAIWTVEEKTPLSHESTGWLIFSKNLLNYLLKINSNVIFCLWGNFAKNLYNNLESKSNFVIESGHPSPFSWKYFHNTKPFSKINQILISQNQPIIDWSK